MAERRRQEMDEKRAKLAELRRARDERKALLAQAESAPGPSSQTTPLTTSRKDVNDLVDSLLQRPSSPYTSTPGRTTPLQTTRGTSALGQISNGASGSVPPTPSGRLSRLSNSSGTPVRERGDSGGLAQAPEITRSVSPLPPSVDYVDHSAELYELPTKVKPAPVVYSKSTQTASSSTGTSTSDVESEGEDGQVEGGRSRRIPNGGSGRETEEEMRRRIIEELDREKAEVEREINELKEREDKLGELTAEQKQAILSAPDFSAFIEASTRIAQRALSDGYDYVKDYTIGLDGAFDDAEGQKIKLVCAFSDDRWTAGRSVTGLDWSSKFPELVAASYNKNPNAPNDPDGIVAVWNLHLLERPEFIFHSPSDILSISFSPFHPTLIFGGSYSGQVLLWDTRAKHLPVLKTPLSASGHTYPIYSMKMVGTQNANSLVSASTDGLVCSWLADMLAQPQEALPLTVPNHSKTDEVSITTLDFPHSETSTFWIGTEEGSIYQANRYDQPSRKAGISTSFEDIYKGHAGPVTGLNFHPSTGSIDFGDLFLTCSVDWSVKLWRTGASGKNQKSKSQQTVPPPPPTPTPGITPGYNRSTTSERIVSTSTKDGSKDLGQQALHSFEAADDYVFDVKWHPHHPALFGTVDGSGKFDLWNLNQDIEVPSISTSVSPRALNKLSWDKTPLARKAATGGADGKVYIYELAEKLVQPRDSEWGDMQRVLAGMKARG